MRKVALHNPPITACVQYPAGRHASPPSAAALLLLSALALGATACGAAAAEPARFPSRDELAKLAEGAPPQHVFKSEAVDALTWELTGPLPDNADGSPAAPATPWQKLLAGAAQGKPGVVASNGMDCAARQVAAFVLAKQALPARPLVRFIAARCGVPVGSMGMGYRMSEMPESSKEDEIYGQWSNGLQKDMTTLLGGGSRLAGIAFARDDKRAVVAMVSASRMVKLESVPLAPAEGKVVLKGELFGAAASIRALVTRGRFGYETCIHDIDVALPAFTVECPVAADDATAHIELAAFQEGRELGDNVLDLKVYPNGKLEAVYNRATAEKEEPALAEPALGAALLTQINAVRKEAGMGELRRAETQSRTAAQLAPYFFAASAGKIDDTVADKVALGLLAGWDVDGLVREGHFASQWIGGHAPAALVEEAMASPFGRETLLDAAVSQIAVGTLLDEESLGAVFSTYSMLDGTGKTDYAAGVLARLNKLRKQVKRAAPEAAPELDGVLADTVSRIEGGESIDDALGRVVEKSLAAVGKGRIHAWIATASSVEKLTYPSEVLALPSLRLGVAVARYRPQGSPWTRLAVVFVSVQDQVANNTARAGHGRSL